MSNYKKFSLDTIKQKLKNGEYEAAVGAMRAIGKTQELSEADKEKARKLVRAHFGIEEGAPAKSKKASKKVAKKAAKKAASKPAKAKATPKKKKASKKAAPAAAAAPKATAKKTSKRASKKAKSARAAASEDDTSPGETKTAEATKSASAPQVMDAKGAVITEMGKVVATMSESLKAMEVAKHMFPKAALEHNVEMVTGAMTRAVRVIDEEVTKPRLRESSNAATDAPSAARKKPSKKGTRAKASSSPPPSEAAAEEPTQANGAHAEDELSEEEQEQLRLARETQQQAD